MWYIAIALRLLMIAVWIKMMSLGGWDFNTPPFISGIGFILVTLYFGLLSIFWPKSMLCPFFGKVWCDSKNK